jgi:hypothetical protein
VFSAACHRLSSRIILDSLLQASGNLDYADMHGYLNMSEHIHTNPRLTYNFHRYVPRIRISWISKLDIQMDIQCGYPRYPNSH